LNLLKSVVAERLRFVTGPDGRESRLRSGATRRGFRCCGCTGRPAAGSCAGRTKGC